MRTNVAKPFTETTHEGARAARINDEQQLRRSIMACMLWEDEFYEDGTAIAERIATLAKTIPFEKVAAIAIEAREQMKLRHVSLWLTVALLKARHGGRKMGDLIARVCQRADEPAELLAMYWKGQEQAPVPKQLKLGLARAIAKFDEYQLAKNNKDGAVKLRDVLFLSHAKPANAERAALYKRIAENTLATPDTWEVALSGGADKKETFLRLMAEGNLGGLAFLRNLRNMAESGVPKQAVLDYAPRAKIDRVLPFRFVAAARALPQWEDVIEPMMLSVTDKQKKLAGRTLLLVDVSGSMDAAISSKSQMQRIDAACGLAILLREIAADVSIWTFSNALAQVAPRRGFALRDAIVNSQQHGQTYLGRAVHSMNQREEYDRLIVITDEQSNDAVENPKGRGYVLNVASNKNGIGYGKWTHIDGWSESVIDYIRQSESAQQ